MTTRTPDEIDLSTFPTGDGEPMAETLANQLQMTDLMFALHALMRAQGRARYAVGGNQFLYYNPYNKREHLSPDVYAALDVEPGPRNVWFTWVEGKCPDIVWEITSPSTQDEDLGHKRDQYAQLGAREYYIYDPQPALLPLFLGYELRDGRYEPLPPLPGGGIMSPLLGTELRPLAMAETAQHPAGVYLRVIDPASGQPLPISTEVERDFIAVRQEFAALRQEFVTLRQDFAAVREQMIWQEQELTTARQNLAAAREQVARQEQDLAAAREQMARQEQDLAAAREQMARQEQELAATRQDLAATRQDLAAARQELAVAREQMIRQEQALRVAEQRAAQAEAALRAALSRRGDVASGDS